MRVGTSNMVSRFDKLKSKKQEHKSWWRANEIH